MIDDDLWDDDFEDDFEPRKSFNDILFELERNGEILKQWENGAPIDNAPTEQKPMRNEERKTIQR